MIRINGENISADGMNLKEYLEQNHYNMQRIAVEINEKIVAKKDYENIAFADNDKVEIVSFVGGG